MLDRRTCWWGSSCCLVHQLFYSTFSQLLRLLTVHTPARPPPSKNYTTRVGHGHCLPGMVDGAKLGLAHPPGPPPWLPCPHALPLAPQVGHAEFIDSRATLAGMRCLADTAIARGLKCVQLHQHEFGADVAAALAPVGFLGPDLLLCCFSFQFFISFYCGCEV